MTFRVEKVVEFRNQGIVNGLVCEICNDSIEIGDSVLYKRTRNVGYTCLHVDCIRAMIADVPSDDSVMGEFNTLCKFGDAELVGMEG